MLSYKMYMSLQLQNHMGWKVWSSWGVVEQISKLPSWRGLQKNHAQLQFYLGIPSFLKMSRVWVWSNFIITLVRGSHEHPIEQTKQTVKVKSSCQSQQRNANQAKRATMCASKACRARGKWESYEHANEQTKQIIKVKSSYLSKQIWPTN